MAVMFREISRPAALVIPINKPPVSVRADAAKVLDLGARKIIDIPQWFKSAAKINILHANPKPFIKSANPLEAIPPNHQRGGGKLANGSRCFRVKSLAAISPIRRAKQSGPLEELDGIQQGGNGRQIPPGSLRLAIRANQLWPNGDNA